MLLCERITPVLVSLAVAIQIVACSRCPESPRGPIRTYAESCYEFITTANKVFYQEAAKSCQEHDGHLVTIKHQDVQVWLENTIRDDLKLDNTFWIGLVRTDSGWRWDANKDVNNQPNDESRDLVYSNWDIEEPDNIRNRKCALFGEKTGFKWRAYTCEFVPFKYHYICQYDGSGGFFTKPANIAGIAAAVVFGIILFIAVGYFILKSHRKRKALLLQLSRAHREYKRNDIEECSFLDSQQRNNDSEDCEKIVPQPHFAPVIPEEDQLSLSHYNFNIAIGNNSANVKPGLNKSIDVAHHRAMSMFERSPNHGEITPVLRSKSNIEGGRNNNMESETEEILFTLHTIEAVDDSSESDADNEDAVSLINGLSSPVIEKPMNVQTSIDNLPPTPVSNASTNNLSG